MVGIVLVGAPISLDGIIGGSAFLISASHQKTQKMACKNTIVWYHPVG